jgi:hypothetical protein
MTDEQLDRMVRAADRNRPDVIEHLDGAEQTLLEEIVSADARSQDRRGMLRRTAGALVAAALLTGVLAASTVLRERPDDPGAGPAAPTVLDDQPAEHQAGPMVYSAAVIKAAEDNPRLLIDQPGWKVTTVYGFAEEHGTIAFDNGGRQMEMNWYPADQYDDYHTDRLAVSKPAPVQVDGRAGDLFRYSDNDFAVMLRPRDGAFVELRVQGLARAAFDRVLADVKHVDVPTWLAALPATIVTPGRVDSAAAKILADVPLPPGFDVGTLETVGVNDPYQFGAEVTGRVGCAWIAEWIRADRAGDDAALGKASDALRSSHQWKVLLDMKDEGGWSEVFWETADGVAAGNTSNGYASAIGCD